MGVAKGAERRPGDEELLLPDGRELRPGAESPALQLVQQVRDEAHRFAITGHRGRRQKARSTSRLEDIPGIGPRRRAACCGISAAWAGCKAAGVEEIARVEGINAALAERIYASLHGLEMPRRNGSRTRRMKLTVPTMLTLLRIVLIPVLVAGVLPALQVDELRRGVRVRRWPRSPTGSMAGSRGATTSPRRSAPSSIRWPTS